ncbi:MAG: M20/M25/M40 family metallo-hydrolase [Candidatus Aminicenantes bacterium]
MKLFFQNRHLHKHLICLAAALLFSASPAALSFPENQEERPPYLDTAQKLLNKGLSEEGAYTILRKIVEVGPRLTGSPQAAAAVERMKQEMIDMGLDNVHLEPTRVQRWVRGPEEECRLVSTQFGTIPLSAAAIGGSIGTPEPGISAQLLEVKSFNELKKLGDRAKGKIVFFNRPMDPTLLNTFAAYGGAADQRVNGAVEAAGAGAIAALVRSLTTRLDDFPHTGLMAYDPDVKKIPAACISTKAANILSDILKKDPSLYVYIKLTCRSLTPVISHNVIGQLTGIEKPEEIILVGGHLDSWDLSPGAHDDGAGCAHSLEALRLLKELGLKPKRTIRAVLFMDEEFGGTGGRDYAASSEREGEIHLAAIESDRGGFLPLGFGIGGDKQTFNNLKKWEYLFRSIGMYWMRRGGGGVDIAPLARGGTITMSLVPDSQRYFDVHHSGKDVITAVNPKELELGAVATALFSYVLAQEGIL